ncbi:hypothetical protein [Micromonospora yangpuensis]|uniref:Uncharacterized protein n=2 Tax=Micromonospora TaxID=1873 RepID=A0A1C6VC64_9ACTN|nr:hypothetical protein [Micromonospora yangpuensis]SCL63644.1 hypothetical protein GA0070617_5261 [Micromonospora yangpuensis]
MDVLEEEVRRNGAQRPTKSYPPVQVGEYGLVDSAHRLSNIRDGIVKNPSDSELMKIYQKGWEYFAPKEGTYARQRYDELKANAPDLSAPDRQRPAAGQQPDHTVIAQAARLGYGPGSGAQPSSSSAPPPPEWGQRPSPGRGGPGGP